MNICRSVFVAAALLGLTACPSQDDDTKAAAKPSAAPPTTLAPAASAPTEIKVEGPAKLAIEPRVKAELDGRADGITGAPLAVAGAKASLQTTTGWQTAKGDPTVAASADKKASIAATSFGPEGAQGKLAAAAAALGLASCEWGPAETVAVGKGKLSASAADGVCTRAGAPVRAAYVAPAAEALLVVGTWDAGGDTTGVFGAMRSIGKATGGDASGIAACCAALRGNAAVAPLEQRGALMFAAGICDSIKNDPQGRAALGQVRAALAGASVPSSCR